ncbi:hypothetical protein [Parasitella parasitica]|uniref:Uncharacterized protein n=1 Tax=Parasitella parasitica TaxID=35722 RepID=A0A0B7MZA7_9FUNG|nr:hypothetical protein [Parasitella parasitica]
MVDNLRSRSIVDKVFVSKTSDADQPFHKRDINADTIEETDGTTTVFKRDQKRSDFSRLGLRSFYDKRQRFEGISQVKSNEQRNITIIMVDRLPITTEVEIFETELLLQDPKAIKKFDCRTRPIQRSL